MKFIDLFAGAGGLSEGFIRQGFEPVAHVEMDYYASQTLLTRAAYYHLLNEHQLDKYNSYLKNEISKDELHSLLPESIKETVVNMEISDETIDHIFGIIDKNLSRFESEKVDVLIGGPPCQAYSLVGRARDPYGKENDIRNYLYKQYVKFLRKYNPDIFVFENVPGILSASKGALFEDVKDIMREAGYELQAKVLNAFDYGVLQQRKRVILIGWNRDLDYKYPDFQTVLHNFRVEDLLSDLPPLQPGGESNYYVAQPSEYLSSFGLRQNSDILTQHITRVHNENDRRIYNHAIDLWNKEGKRLRYTDLPADLITHKNLTSFLDRFKVVGSDLPFSHTVVSHIAKDGHYYIHPDIKQLRSLSVREAARLQSFPDNFYFEGPRTAIFTQIGNAVPPLMAESIAERVKDMLEKK
ncbi:DNA cytosine methyltransferase [Paenibacillus sp. S-38]|uniref:DNA cytosine methyltransferase n=1 Tax=Paenibacillus sp. S-38 TaxID=3416710 RepID=UPI003CEFA838